MDLTRSLEAREADLKAALAQGRQLASERDGLERVAAKVGAPAVCQPACAATSNSVQPQFCPVCQAKTAVILHTQHVCRQVL
jgi:hypothetical protein